MNNTVPLSLHGRGCPHHREPATDQNLKPDREKDPSQEEVPPTLTPAKHDPYGPGRTGRVGSWDTRGTSRHGYAPV